MTDKKTFKDLVENASCAAVSVGAIPTAPLGSPTPIQKRSLKPPHYEKRDKSKNEK